MSIDEWIKKMLYIYNGTIKREEIMSFAATWMDLEVITLSEISQKEKDKYHMIPLICGIYNMTQMNLLTKQKQPHRHRKQCGCPSWGRDKLGVRD